MKRRLFSLSLLSAISALPTARRFLAAPLERVLAWSPGAPISQGQPPAIGTVVLVPIGYGGLPFRVAPVSKTGEIITQPVHSDFTPPGSPQIRTEIRVPLIRTGRFPLIPVGEPFRLVQGTMDFGDEVGVLPFTVIVVQPERAWFSRGARVVATGELLTVRTITGEETPLIVTEELGFSPLLQISSALRRFLEERGVEVELFTESAMVPTLRQRVLQTSGGMVTFTAPDPLLDSETIERLGAIQVRIWSPVPITIVERAG